MIRKGSCWDNAEAENFFKILKSELIYQLPVLHFEKAKIEIFEIWYSKMRKLYYPNSPIPRQFEKSHQSKAT